jgi:hypothetical protein
LLGDGSSVVVNAAPHHWHRADTVQLTGSSVDTWDDLSGNGRNLTQVGASRPTWNASSTYFGGRPSLTYASASAQYMTHGGGVYPTTGDAEVFCILRATQTKAAASASSGLWSYNASTAIYPHTVGTSYIIPSFYVVNTFGDIDPSPVDITTGHVLHCYTNGTGLTTVTEQNGVTSIADSSVTMSYPAGTNEFIGRSVASSRYFDGEMAELIFFDRLLTAVERQNIIGYLARRYGYDLGDYFLLEGSADRYLLEGSTVDRYRQE